MFLVDVGVPADIAPDVHRLEGAFLYSLADLERIAEAYDAMYRELAMAHRATQQRNARRTAGA